MTSQRIARVFKSRLSAHSSSFRSESAANSLRLAYLRAAPLDQLLTNFSLLKNLINDFDGILCKFSTLRLKIGIHFLLVLFEEIKANNGDV